MISTRLVVCIIMLIVPLGVKLHDHFEVKFSHAECTVFNREIVANASCTSRIINRTRRASVEAHLQPGVKLDNIYVMLQLFLKFGTVYRPHIIKIEQEFCQYLKDKTTSQLFPIVEKMWMRHGNFMDPCPITGYRYLKDMEADLDWPIPIFPAGDWRLDFSVSTIINNTKTKLGFLREFYEIKTKTALQWKHELYISRAPYRGKCGASPVVSTSKTTDIAKGDAFSFDTQIMKAYKDKTKEMNGVYGF